MWKKVRYRYIYIHCCGDEFSLRLNRLFNIQKHQKNPVPTKMTSKVFYELLLRSCEHFKFFRKFRNESTALWWYKYFLYQNKALSEVNKILAKILCSGEEKYLMSKTWFQALKHKKSSSKNDLQSCQGTLIKVVWRFTILFFLFLWLGFIFFYGFRGCTDIFWEKLKP